MLSSNVGTHGQNECNLSSSSSQAALKPPTVEDADSGAGGPCGGQPPSVEILLSLSKEQRGWRKIIGNFTASVCPVLELLAELKNPIRWFSITMGTGIVSILLHNLPYNGVWLYWISVVIFAVNVFLFGLFLLISILRYSVYPEIWTAMIRHPEESLFVGTFPIGLTTIINMIVFVCVSIWGEPAVYVAWALWWIDMVIATFSCSYLPWVIMYHHETELSSMTAAWLLPIVATIVAAASGGNVASVLPNPHYALWTVILSYILWGTGLPLAMTILVIYFQRLTVHKLPPREVIVSVFLPLGPLGQGGFAIMRLGKVALKIFPVTHTLQLATGNAGEILYVVGWLTAVIMWGFAVVWLFFALASISRSKFPFNMGWWGFTFPLGVFAVSTTTLGKEIPSTFFDVLGTILSVFLTLLWIVVACGTVRKLAMGKLLSAPCLKDLEGIQRAHAANHVGEHAV